MSSESDTESESEIEGNPLVTLLKYRTPGPWGTGKGANLTPHEVDENFYDVARDLDLLRANPALPLEINNIEVEDNLLTITMSDGTTTFGPFVLPVAAFRFTGDYQAGFAYGLYDFFTADDGLYLVLIAHTAATEFDPSETVGPLPVYQLIMPFPNLYDVGFFFPGVPGTGIDDGMAMFSFKFPRDVFILTDAPECVASVEVMPALDLVCDIFRNGETDPIGSFTIAAGDTEATFDWESDQQFVTGDRIRVLRPTELDSTALDLNVTFVAKKGTIGGTE